MRVSMRPWPFSTVVLRDQLVLRRGVEIGFRPPLPSSADCPSAATENRLWLDDLGGDVDLTTHGVDGDEGAFELPGLGQLVEQIGMAVISLVFSGTLSCARTRRALVA